MRRIVPSRSSLIAFEAASRHQSFVRAASELALSESAISRQVSALEDQLGIKLFNRVRKRVVLTRAGEHYGSQVRHTLDQMERDMLNIMAHAGMRGVFELAVLPTFCSQWLIPRLNDFYARHSDVAINVSARSVMFLFRDTNFDAAIHYGRPNWPGAIAEHLFGEDVVAVCSPNVLKGRRRFSVEDVASQGLLHLTSRPEEWRKWFSSAGLAGATSMQGTRYEHFSLLISAACAGLGVALIPRFLILKELERKELVVANSLALEGDGAYYLVYPEEKASDVLLGQFRDWLVGQAGSP